MEYYLHSKYYESSHKKNVQKINPSKIPFKAKINFAKLFQRKEIEANNRNKNTQEVASNIAITIRRKNQG
jgi:hypothetical protein